MNNTQQISSPVWEQLLEDAWNDGAFFSQRGNGAAAGRSSLMNRIDRTFPDAQLVPLAPFALGASAQLSDLAPPFCSIGDEQAGAERAPLAERNVLILSAGSTDRPEEIDASAAQPEQRGAPPAPSRKRQREMVAASSSSCRSRPALDFETVYVDLVQLMDRYSAKNPEPPLHTLPSKIMRLIMMIDDQILLNRDQKKRLLALFHRAKHHLPPSQNQNPWLDLFRLYPDFENVLRKIVGEETFLELRNSFFVDEEEELVFSRSMNQADAPSLYASNGFDEYFDELAASLGKRIKMPEKSFYEKETKRYEIKRAILFQINKGFKHLARITEEQEDRLVQLMIKTGENYPPTYHPIAKPFYDFCKEKLKGLLGQTKLDQLVRTLKNQAEPPPIASFTEIISQTHGAPPAADSEAAR